MLIKKHVKEKLAKFKFNPEGYREEIDELNNILGLTGDCELKPLMPTYYAGDLEIENPIVIIGANPGIGRDNNDKEEAERKKDYFGFMDCFFSKYAKYGPRSHYYEDANRIWGLVKGITGENAEKREKYEVYQRHVINIDFIPYHSKQFHEPKSKNDKAIKYIEERRAHLRQYLRELKSPQLLIFNSGLYKNLLSFELEEDNCLTFKSTGKKMYMFRYEGIPAVWFEAQLGSKANRNNSKDIEDCVKYIKAFLESVQ